MIYFHTGSCRSEFMQSIGKVIPARELMCEYCRSKYGTQFTAWKKQVEVEEENKEQPTKRPREEDNDYIPGEKETELNTEVHNKQRLPFASGDATGNDGTKFNLGTINRKMFDESVTDKCSQESSESTQSIFDQLSESLSYSTPDLDDEFRDIDSENKQKFTLLQEFFSRLSGGDLEIQYKWKRDDVSEKVNRSRGKLLDTMVNYLLKTIFPGADDSAYETIVDLAFHRKVDDNSSVILDKIIEAYNSTQSKQVKKYLIMELTLAKKFKDLQDVLPGLTMYQYKLAKQNVRDSGLDKIPEKGYQSVTRNRRDYDSTVFFVSFFSNFVRVRIAHRYASVLYVKNLQDVSYGAKDVQLSTGETVTCQNAVQEVLTEVIIRMYQRHYEVKFKAPRICVSYSCHPYCRKKRRDMRKSRHCLSPSNCMGRQP